MTKEKSDGFEQELSRYIVGIDLGTTNCAVAYVDTEFLSQATSAPGIRAFPVEQWVDFGVLEKRELLPSFLYQPLPTEQETLRQAGEKSAEQIVGSLARDRGLQLPGRQICSAKSWLCHAGVDRREQILPWQSDDGVTKLSPVQASAHYLTQIRRAWDKAFRNHPLAEQDIVLTLPASFDQVARQLTIEAAAMAGLEKILPIEEPQAAFYAWLARHEADWETQVQPGQTILVCDIGGGTTDFTLIRVREAANRDEESNHSGSLKDQAETLDEEHRGRLSLHRVAVGQHLILGGDNIDLALAKMAENKLTGGSSLPPRSWDALRQACRVAKETLLGESPPAGYTIHLPGSGSRLIGGGRQIEVTQDEVRGCVIDGFFPDCALEDRPLQQQVGFQEFGLPFATDPAITKHLAAFLWGHRADGRTDHELATLDELAQARPDWVLFNGGVMASEQLRGRVTQAIGVWFGGVNDLPKDWTPGVLAGERLDLAVSKGATYFGRVRRGLGVRIEAKLACSYYLQTSLNPPRAICIVPGSASPGDRFELTESPLELIVGQPVQFPVAYSSTRLADRAGDIVELTEEDFSILPPLRTVVELSGARRKQTMPVVIGVELSQIGTLQMYCQAKTEHHQWKLEFDVRESTQTDFQRSREAGAELGTLDEEVANAARRVLEQTFGDSEDVKPAQLVAALTEAMGKNRSKWPPSLLRAMWSDLMRLETGRGKSAAHEARWLNLLGYCLRPGYGLAADDWRVASTWRTMQGKLAFATPTSRNESLILWRRIAGGFTAGQQLTVYQQVASPLRATLDPTRRAKGSGGCTATELIELLRLVGSLELLPKAEKWQLGSWLIELLSVKKWSSCQAAALWTIGRLGSRTPAYGPLNTVIDAARVEKWLRQLCQLALTDPNYWLCLMLCARRVQDRYRDVSDETRALVAKCMQSANASEHYVALVTQGGQLQSEETAQILGEALPLGLNA
ncbi:MAG: Hsp70 family protein [Planctomycetales bacterium]|nr:Hsp70 family protein [Planctomycetales bacterium]